jgi:putative ABC transport system substrate-binding protein
MAQLGYVRGHNLVVESRYADGKPERLPALAAELAQLKVDVIVAAAYAPRRSRSSWPTTAILSGTGSWPAWRGPEAT